MTTLLIIYATITLLGLMFWPDALAESKAAQVWTWATWPVPVVIVCWLAVLDTLEDVG